MTRIFTSDFRERNRNYPDPFPVEKIKRVDRPTNVIHDEQVQRVDERHGGFYRAWNGEFGDHPTRNTNGLWSNIPCRAHW